MKDSIIGKISITVFSCVVFAFALYSGRALMSYLFQEFYSGAAASAPGDLDNARFKDELSLVKDTLVNADRDGETPVSVQAPAPDSTEGLPPGVDSSLTENPPLPVSSDSLSQDSRFVVLQAGDRVDDFLFREPDLEIPADPDDEVAAGENDDADPAPGTEANPTIAGTAPEGDGGENPATENPPTDNPEDGGINLEIGNDDAPIVAADLEIGDDVEMTLDLNLSAEATISGGETPASLPVEELAEEVVTATPPVDALVLELEARAARILKRGAAQTPRNVRSTPRRVAQPGRIYSGALAGSVSGMIGGMDAPTTTLSRVQHRPVIINGVNASNRAAIDASGATAILSSAQPSIPNAGAIAGVTSPGGVPTVAPTGQITLPTPGVAVGVTTGINTGGGGASAPILPSTGLPLPGGLGVNTGGISINVNLGL